MSLYTERHGMRIPIERTTTITPPIYRLLLDCCKGYYKNISWRFPSYESTSTRIFGEIDERALIRFLLVEIPTLYGISKNKSERSNVIASPVLKGRTPYDQYALLDFIEFIADNIKDVSVKRSEKSYGSDELVFSRSSKTFVAFRNEINNIFDKAGLLFALTEQKVVERIIENGVLSPEIESVVNDVTEVGTKELLQEAMTLFRQPNPSGRKDATEKIWDAFERLKTHYPSLDKKSSVTKVVNDMSGGLADFVSLFDAEFRALTQIGNSFRIRHHETDQIDTTDPNHYDYFFNRCLSLIALAIKYLK